MADTEQPDTGAEATESESGRDKKADAKVLAEAKKRFELCVSAEKDQRSESLDDLKFLAGDQWPQASKRERELDSRPYLVLNRMDQFVQHIANAQRQNRVSARVFPVDSQGDPDTAEVLQGMIRAIEQNAESPADIAYDTAAFYAVAIGFGYWKLCAYPVDPYSFDYEVRIERVKNPFNVYLGPHNLPTGADARFGFEFEDYTKDEYELAFPDSELANATDWMSIGDQPPGWLEQNGCRVVTYYNIDYRADTVFKLKDGSNVLKSQLPPKFKMSKLAKNPKTGEPIQRDTQVPTVRCYKLNAVEILEETTWPGYCLPLMKVTGSELNVDGKDILKGIIRNLKDAQRQLNKFVTDQSEAADASKGPIICVEGQLEGYEAEWEQANKRKILQYRQKVIDGQVAPPPSRLQANASIAAMTEARMMAADDLKALTGIYDAALGQKSNEQSGVAIESRQQQSDTANYHFQDNLTRTIAHSTKAMLDAIPTYYDAKRMVRIVGEDETQKVVALNQQWKDPQTGEEYWHRMDLGKYDVVCTAGPSFATKRQQATRQMVDLVRSTPQVMEVAPDLIFKSIDMPYANEISERFKKVLPPQLQDHNEQGQVPPEVQQKMAEMTQAHAALNHYAQQMEQKVKELEMEKKAGVVKGEYSLQIARLNNDIKVLTALITAKSQNAAQEAEMYQEFWRENHNADHEAAMGAASHAADLQMAQVQHGQSMQMADQSHQNSLEQQAAQPEPAAPQE